MCVFSVCVQQGGPVYLVLCLLVYLRVCVVFVGVDVLVLLETVRCHTGIYVLAVNIHSRTLFKDNIKYINILHI